MSARREGFCVLRILSFGTTYIYIEEQLWETQW